jgi:hypothetical protein
MGMTRPRPLFGVSTIPFQTACWTVSTRVSVRVSIRAAHFAEVGVVEIKRANERSEPAADLCWRAERLLASLVVPTAWLGTPPSPAPRRARADCPRTLP